MGSTALQLRPGVRVGVDYSLDGVSLSKVWRELVRDGEISASTDDNVTYGVRESTGMVQSTVGMDGSGGGVGGGGGGGGFTPFIDGSTPRARALMQTLSQSAADSKVRRI